MLSNMQKEKAKILHIIVNDKFTLSYINFMNKCLSEYMHTFLVPRKGFFMTSNCSLTNHEASVSRSGKPKSSAMSFAVAVPSSGPDRFIPRCSSSKPKSFAFISVTSSDQRRPMAAGMNMGGQDTWAMSRRSRAMIQFFHLCSSCGFSMSKLRFDTIILFYVCQQIYYMT